MAVLFGGVAVGCDGPRYVALDSGAPDASMPTGTLTLVSSASLMLRPGQTTSIDVRFLDAGGSPAAGIVVAAAIEGTALDSSLGALSVTTDASGLAHASLVAGTAASSFRVRLSAREASSSVYVDVGVGTSFGALLVHAPYTGTRPVTRRTVDVVPSTTCVALSAMPPATGGRTVLSLVDDVTITALPTTLTYAVLVRASGDLALEAEGCVEGLVPSTGTTTTVTVPLVEVPLGVDGAYTVQASIDAGGLVEGHVHDWAASLRVAVATAGGDGALLLNGVEAELARAGSSTAAAQLHALRTTRSLDGALEAQLGADGTTPSEVVASLLDEAAVALDAPTVDVALTLGMAGTGTMTTQALVCSDGRSGTVRLSRATPVVRSISPTMALDGTIMLAGPIDAPIGALALAWANAVAADRSHLPGGVADVMAEACASLETFAATADGTAALVACDATCRLAACQTTLDELTMLVTSSGEVVDQDIDHANIQAAIVTRDDDGDARVDRLDGTLHGELVSASGALVGTAGALSGTLTGTRAAIP